MTDWLQKEIGSTASDIRFRLGMWASWSAYVKPSGDKPFDNSAVAAIKNIGVLTEVKIMNPSEVSRHHLFNMTFTPDDLAL